MLENARDYSKSGKNERASATYDTFIKEFPDYGRSDGQIVPLLLERIHAMGLGKNDPKRIELLTAIWNDETLTKYPQILNVGREIVGLADFLRSHDVISKVGTEWIAIYSRAFSTLTDEEIKRFGGRRVIRTSRFNIGSASGGKR